VETDDVPPDVVYEEISGGYLYGERILKLAKVTVTKRKEL
jgi:molecular chaperone GrpE (heat shock protein)